MDKRIDIDAINDLYHQEQVYVLVAGGIAVGKSHFIREHIDLKKYKLMDVDDYLERIGGKHSNPDEYKQAMEMISADFDQLMKSRYALIAMGTAANFNFTVNRLLNAKLKGYKTVLLHITGVSYLEALSQNQERREAGKRAVESGRGELLAKTITYSNFTVEKLAPTDLVDFYCSFSNSRKF